MPTSVAHSGNAPAKPYPSDRGFCAWTAQAWFLFSGTYRDGNGIGYRTGIFTQAWASNTEYCSSSVHSSAPLVMECLPARFDWHTLSDLGNKDVNLYNPDDGSLILSIKGIIEMPSSQFKMPNTTM